MEGSYEFSIPQSVSKCIASSCILVVFVCLREVFEVQEVVEVSICTQLLSDEDELNQQEPKPPPSPYSHGENQR